MATTWLRDELERQKTHPVPDAPREATPSVSIVVPDAAVDLTAENKAELDARLSLYQDYVKMPQLTWAELAAKHRVSVGKARYIVEVAELQGEDGLIPGEWARHTGIPIDLQWKVIEMYRSDMQRTPMDIYQDEEFQRLLQKSGVSVSYKQVWYFLRNLPDDPTGDARRSGRPRPLLPPFLSDGRFAYTPKRPLEVVQVDETIGDFL